MNKYAVISIELFNEEMLNGIRYPVRSEINGHLVLEYLEATPDPTGEWIIFEGVGANVRCAEYLYNYNNIIDNN